MAKSAEILSHSMIPPGSTIGILGSGQLGRMLAAAAVRMGYHVVVFSPEVNSPAGEAATYEMVGDYEDEAALQQFAHRVDVVTLEFENIPVKSLEFLSQYVPVRPDAEALRIAQDRVEEKTFFDRHHIRTARWQRISNREELEICRKAHPVTVLKLARFGYDGKGQWTVTQNSSLPNFSGIAILEEKISFTKEISVIAARGVDGRITCFPPVHNIHKSHILHESFAPADIASDIASKAVLIAEKIIEALDMIGLIAVEMFLNDENELFVNEIAPRPHNSGHWSMDGATICQFELLIRAVCGLPLQMPQLISPVRMLNLLGDDIDKYTDYLSYENARLYLYGKNEVKPGRKMGHVNFIGQTSRS